MNEGWIKLHRQMWDNPRSSDPDWVAVWMYLLCHASHQPTKKVFDGKVINIKPGQLVSGRLLIAQKTGVNETKVWRLLERLKSERQIEQLGGCKSSLITILKWDDYQSGEQQIEQQTSSKRATSEQQVSTYKECKNVRRENAEGDLPSPVAPTNPEPTETVQNAHDYDFPQGKPASAEPAPSGGPVISRSSDAREVFCFFLKHTGRAVPPHPKLLLTIESLLQDRTAPATVADCRLAIRWCCKEWHEDKRMAGNLTIPTIFGKPEKFWGYVDNGRRVFGSAPPPSTHPRPLKIDRTPQKTPEQRRQDNIDGLTSLIQAYDQLGKTERVESLKQELAELQSQPAGVAA